MYMYAVRCTCMRYDVHMCNFDLYECGSICIYLFQCIYMRFDVYMLNFVVYVYSLIILSVTGRHSVAAKVVRELMQLSLTIF